MSSDLPKVFLSYVRDRVDFVRQYTEALSSGGDFVFEDWITDGVPAGALLNAALEKKISEASAFIAFIDDEYGDKIAGREFDFALPKALLEESKFIVIPIFLSQVGMKWYKEQTTKKLENTELRDLVYNDQFYDHLGNIRYPGQLEHLHLKDAIRKQRKWLIGELDKRRLQEVEEIRAKEENNRKYSESIAFKIRNAETVVILGSPTSDLPDFKKPAGELKDLLTERGVVTKQWGDFWVNKGRVPDSEIPDPPVVFIQPASGEELKSHLDPDQADLTSNFLKSIKPALAKSLVVLWDPLEDGLDELKEIYEININESLAVRRCSPGALACLLESASSSDLPRPVFASQEMQFSEQNDVPLKTKIQEIIVPHLPEEKYTTYYFYADRFTKVFEQFAGARPIVLFHDLNLSVKFAPGTQNRVPTSVLIDLFEPIQEKAAPILEKMNLKKEDVFWVACVTNPSITNSFPKNLTVLPIPRISRWAYLPVHGDHPTPEEREDFDKLVTAWKNTWNKNLPLEQGGA